MDTFKEWFRDNFPGLAKFFGITGGSTSAGAGAGGETVGSATRPVWLDDGMITAMDRGSNGDLYMGQGKTSDPIWTSVTGYTSDAANHKWKVSRDGTNFYVNIGVADGDSYGVVKLGYSESGDNYAVKKNTSGQLYVTVDVPSSPDLSNYATKTWVTNNFCETDGTTITNIKNRLSALEAKI